MSVVSTGPAPTNRSRHAPRPGSLYYEKELRAASVTHKHYIAGVAVVTLSGSTWATQYLHRDHLGSVTAITDHTGTVIERFAYDPWGKRRFPDGAPDPNGTIRGDPTLAFATDRGFTNHEHLDGLGLIHMNGRIFDPTLARFASADPHIQHAGNMQSYNRYSYVLNNPLIHTDPTGFFLKKLFKGVKKLVKKILKNPIVRAVVGIAVGVMTGYWAFDKAFWAGIQSGLVGTQITAFAGFVGGAAGGFAGSLVTSGGDVKSALQGAITGAAFGFVGGSWGANSIKNYAGHAVVGCASAEAQGGNCARGAAAQLASKWATINTPQGTNFVAATVVGGTVSVIGGGKFANGALTGAAGYLYNNCAKGCAWKNLAYNGSDEIPVPTGKSQIKWSGEVYWSTSVSLDAILFRMKLPLPETAWQFGYEFGYREYELKVYSRPYVYFPDGVSSGKRYIYGLTQTPRTVWRADPADNTRYVRKHSRICVFGACTQ